MREAAHEIRFAGNEAAHGDLVETISVEEAAEVVELVDAILERVYHEPREGRPRPRQPRGTEEP